MATTPRNIRFDDDVYKEMKAISKRPLTTAYHIQEACRQYLTQFDKPVIKTKAVVVPAKIYSSDDYSTAVRMYELVCYVAPHTKKPNYEKWADVIRLMREVDGIPIETIKKVFKWANSDDFWKTNILSPSKLRKQFNQLQPKMVNTHGQANQPNGNTKPNKLTPAEQVAARRAESQRQHGSDVGFLGSNDHNVPQRMDENRGDGADGDMGTVIHGTCSRAD